jgi:hypothetical protein
MVEATSAAKLIVSDITTTEKFLNDNGISFKVYLNQHNLK